MTLESSNWTSFWDIATPEQAAAFMIEHYGPGAAKAAALCAFSARDDGRGADFDYWKKVFDEIGCCPPDRIDP